VNEDCGDRELGGCLANHQAATCLAGSTEYAWIMELAFKAAYADRVPDVKTYFNDSDDWGKKLYNACSASNQVRQFDLDILISSSKASVNRFSMILNYLDKKKVGYDKKLYQLILSQQMMKLTLGAGHLNEDWPSFIQDIWPKLIASLKKMSGPDGDALRKLIQEIQDEITKEAGANAAHDIGDMYMKNTEFARIMTLVATNFLIAQRMANGYHNGAEVADSLEELEKQVNNSSKVAQWMKSKLPHVKDLTSVL
jgi:hypothetical protein